MIKFHYLYRCKNCSRTLTRDEEYCSRCKRELRQSNKDEMAKKSNISEAPKKPAKCLICGKSAQNDGLYCSYCLEKHILTRPHSKYEYRDPEEKHNNKDYKCVNGAMVRSQQELIVSLILELNGIEHIYEYPLFDKEMAKNNKPIKPDFFLPEIQTKDGRIIKNIFLEHFGWNINDHSGKTDKKHDESYEEKTYYKLPKYRDMGLTVICTSYEDIKNANEKIIDKILKCKEGEINGLDETMLSPEYYKEFMSSSEQSKK